MGCNSNAGESKNRGASQKDLKKAAIMNLIMMMNLNKLSAVR